MATKQQAKSNVKIAHGAVVCEECELIGDVSIGSKTVIHPKARIVAEAGPIVIGDNNLIEEQVHIINKYPSDDFRPSRNEVIELTIGNNNVFEVGSYSEALRIGDSNIVECKAKLSRHTVLTNGCVIGAMCDLETDEVVPENTVIYGKHHHRRVQAERPTPQTLQLDFLTKILPNYHHILKPTSQKANVM